MITEKIKNMTPLWKNDIMFLPWKFIFHSRGFQFPAVKNYISCCENKIYTAEKPNRTNLKM